MDSLLEKQCFFHHQKYLAVSLELENKDSNKYLCPQCLIELINPQELILISEAKRQNQNKKNQISKNIEEQCKNKINLATNLKNSVKEFKGPLEQMFIKINEEIEQFKIQTEKQIQENENNTPENLDTDLVLLTDGQNNCSLQQKIENDLLWVKQLLDQFQFSEISSLLKQKIIEILSKSYEISKLQIESDDQKNKKSKLTPALKFQCQSHDQQIVMVQLDENSKFKQYSCVQCISQNQGKYITLIQLQSFFEAYYQSSEKSFKYCQQLRGQITNEIIKICKELRNSYIQTINLQIKQLEENFKSFEKLIQTNLQFKDLNIFQFEQEKLLSILEPIFQDENPNHCLKIIEKQLELDKQLFLKFESQMQELIGFEVRNSYQVKLKQLDNQLILKKVEILFGQQQLKQQNIQYDYEFINLENQINSFLLKKMQQCVLNEQYQQLLLNRYKLQNDQAELIQNTMIAQDKLRGQQKNCEKKQIISEQILEKQIAYLETHKNQLNSISFCNQIQKEIQIQTNETIESINNEINEQKYTITQLEENIIEKNLANESLQKEINESKLKITQLEENITKIQIQKNDTVQSLQKEINELKFKITLIEEQKVIKQESLHSILTNPYQPQFINTYKHANCSIVHSKLVSGVGWGLAIMQPPLPKNKETSFIIKINKVGGWVGVGICHLQTAQSFGYNMNGSWSTPNQNSFIAYSDGCTNSSWQFNSNGSFGFNQGSFLHCLYDPIKFKFYLFHVNNGNTYQVDLQNNNLEMSPCVALNSGAEIERI